MFDKIKSKIDPEVSSAFNDTATAAIKGVKIGLMAGVILLPLTIAIALVEKAAR